MFARYSNIKAGKFQATEAEKMSDTYSEEEFENLNDVAKVLGTIGISIQEGNDFKGFQEVFDEIIAKWEDLNEIQKNAIATAVAGTRQREALYTALENSTRITDLMTISMNSLGTAEEKMAAYSDSVEASQKRVTDAFEEWVLKMNGSPVLKTFNNLLATTIENVDALAISLGAVFAASQWKRLISLGAAGLEKLGEKFMNLGSMNFFSQGGEKVNIAQGLKNYAEELNLKFATNSIDELNKKFISLGKGMDDTTLSIVKQGQAALMSSNSMNSLKNSASLLYWVEQDSISQELQNQIIEELGIKGTQEEIAVRKLLTQQLDKETKQRIANNINSPSAASKIASGIGSLVGAGLGLSAGQFWGNKFGGDTGSVYGGMLGTIGGGVVGSKAISSIGKIAGAAKAAGGLGALIKSVIAGGASIGGPIAWAVGGAALAGAAVWGWVKSAQEKAKQEAIKAATEAAAEIEEQYKSVISSTSNVQRYDELAKGVDTLGRNVSLTDDEYKEFLDTSNALAEVFPELVVRTDEFGNRLLGANDKVGTITNSVNELTLAMQRSYNASLVNKDLMGSVLEDAQNPIDESLKNIKQYKNDLSLLKNLKESIEDIKLVDTYELWKEEWENDPNNYLIPNKEQSEATKAIYIGNVDAAEKIREELIKNNIDEYSDLASGITDYLYVSSENATKALQIIKDIDVSTQIKDTEQLIAEEQRKINSQKKAMEPYYSALAQQEVGEEVWNAYSEEQQQALSSIISTIDLFNENGTKKSIDEYQNDIREMTFSVQQIIAENPLIFDIIYSNNDSKTLKEVKDARDDLLLTLLSMLPNGASIDEINGILIPFGFEYQEEGSIIDTQDYDRLLQERGLSENVAKQLGNVDIETLKYAYEELDTEILKTIKDIDDFYNEVFDSKLAEDNLSLAISQYEKLNKIIKKNDSQTAQWEKAKNKILSYAQALGVAGEEFDVILSKAKQMPETDLFGTTSLTPTEVNDKYKNYQSYLDYIKNDYNGTWDATQLATMTEENPELIAYLDDIEKLTSYLEDYVSNGEMEFNNSIQRMIVESEEGTQSFLAANDEWVQGVADSYNINLNDFSTLASAKYALDLALSGNIEGTWDAWVGAMSEKYDQDFANFSSKTAAKMAMLNAMASAEGSQTFDQWVEDRNFAPGTYTLDEMMQIYQNESGYKLNSPDTWTGNLENVFDEIEEQINELNLSVGNVGGGSSSGGGGGSSQTMEDILNARKALINKEYEAMVAYDESTGKAVHTKYFEKMKDVLNAQLNYYNSLLKTAQTESERLDTLQKIQNVQVELANLNDEELQDELNLAQTKEASLSAQIDIQNQLIEAADTEEERIQRQKELNDLIKQEYELRVSINDFQMSLLERQANRVNPDSPLYEDLINEQIKESQNNTDLALEQIDRVREKLVKQYMSEKNPDGSFKYNIDEVRELVENSEEMQALYQTYLDNIDKATELVLEYASARLDRIDARINELEQTKPKEWTSIEQIIEYSDKNLDLLRGKIPILQEALSHSAEMTNEQIQSYVDQLNDVYAAIKEAEIQKQQDIIDYHDNVYDALTWQIQEYINQIEKQKQVVEDYYDDEIDKINKVNDAKERTIELEKLQDEILRARKDKARVWREGIGFVYEEDRNKVKEAEQNLDDFMTQDKVNDLNNAKDQELADLDERIENWNKYLEAIQDAHDAYEDSTKEHLLFELLHVQTQEELYEKLHDDMQNYIFTYDQNLDAYKNSLGEYGDLNTEYTGIFDDFLDSYKEALRKFDELTQSFNDVVNSDDFLNGDRNPGTLPGGGEDIYEDAMSEREAREKLAEYSKLYFEARNRGDWQGMKHWNDTANDLRREMGWYDEIFVASDAIEAFKNGRTLQAVNGKAPEGARPGDRIVTEGGTYLIIGKKADGTWESVKLDTTSTSTGSGSRNPLDPIETSYKGYANGLEEGPVTTTGLAMLHGTPLRPEYVLNHDQAWNLLHNFSTLKTPEFNKTNTTNQTNNNFSGDIILNDVKDPQDFWKKLMQATSNRFNVTKRGR